MLKPEAAVLIALRGRGAEQELLLIERAKHLRKHAGEIALPGGYREPSDRSLQDTAVREAFEEVRLPPSSLSLVGQMAGRHTRQGVRVTPYVADVVQAVELAASPQEIASFFWLPLGFLRADPRVQTDIFCVKNTEYWAPRYLYQRHTLWGFTARLLLDFLNEFQAFNFERQHSAPEVMFST